MCGVGGIHESLELLKPQPFLLRRSRIPAVMPNIASEEGSGMAEVSETETLSIPIVLIGDWLDAGA